MSILERMGMCLKNKKMCEKITRSSLDEKAPNLIEYVEKNFEKSISSSPVKHLIFKYELSSNGQDSEFIMMDTEENITIDLKNMSSIEKVIIKSLIIFRKTSENFEVEEIKYVFKSQTEKNLYEAIKDRKSYLPEKRVKRWIYQILKALEFMHRNGIFHRDIKPENILLRNGDVKLADFGSCKSIYSKTPFTEYISTRWYRSPECLLTDGYYNFKMDIWGLGCVFFEMLTLIPLFPGDDEIDQVNKIHKILGSPSRDLLNKFLVHSQRNEADFPTKLGCGIKRYLQRISPLCQDLIEKMLCYDPEKRYTAKECLNHEYFRDLVEKDNQQKNKLLLLSLNRNSLLISNNNISTYYDKDVEIFDFDDNKSSNIKN